MNTFIKNFFRILQYSNIYICARTRARARARACVCVCVCDY